MTRIGVFWGCLGVAAALLFAGSASGAAPGPAWEVSSVAQPTNFSVEDNVKCAISGESLCDQYLVTLTNVGGGPASGGTPNRPVTIVDTLPSGLKVVTGRGRGVRGYNVGKPNEQMDCGTATTMGVTTVTCSYGGTVEPDATLAVFVEVEVEATTSAGAITNAVSVSGGGAPPASTSAPLTLSNTVGGPPAAFGISAFDFAAHDASGGTDTQAGDHPSGVASTVNLNTAVETLPLSPSGMFHMETVEVTKDFVVYAPLGFLGDPLAAARCTDLQLLASGGAYDTECPAASRVGRLLVFDGKTVESSADPIFYAGTDVYNVAPEAGYAAQFGFKAGDHVVSLYASVVHTAAGYAVRVAAPGVPHVNVHGTTVTLFGDPRVADGEPASSAQAFFTNPDDCSAGPSVARVQVDSWLHQGQWVSGETAAYPEITGCDLLQFEPTVAMRPEVTQAEAPSGYEFKIRVPQPPELSPILATPQLKNLTMALPEGMTLSPGAGDGLVGCEATGPHGIDMPTGGSTPTDVGEGQEGERGEEIGEDGMSHLVPGHCPRASQIGTVQIKTPVLERPVEGRVYVAQPACGGTGPSECTAADAADGKLFGLYLEADDPGSGVVIKLAASASVDPSTGRITARFLENPQFPVSEVAVQLKGGERAPLANPRQCGEATTAADLTPWSAPMTPDAIVASGFGVSWNGAGGPCPATLPFAPALVAGPVNLAAGRFTPLTVTITRGDRQQDLSRVQVHMPAGLLGMLSKVTLCGEPQAARGECGEASQIGTVHVAAGSGSQPLWVSGKVYLTGPYEGAPFGLSVVVAAVAGPFNLGDVVVRARIDVDPSTSALTVTSDPLPQFRDGVPLRIQTLNIAIEREGFVFNPTNCAPKQIATTIEAEQGASASPTASFAAEGCGNLSFGPRFAASTQAKASKAKGASLAVKVTPPSGQANIAKAVVSLPKQTARAADHAAAGLPGSDLRRQPRELPDGVGCRHRPCRDPGAERTARRPRLPRLPRRRRVPGSRGDPAGAGHSPGSGRQHRHREGHHHQLVQVDPRRAHLEL